MVINKFLVRKFRWIVPKVYSIDSPMYAADSVEKTRACTELAKIPSTITGKGIKSGTNKQRTDTTISSAKMFPNKRKLNDKGLVKSSKILIGRKILWENLFTLRIPWQKQNAVAVPPLPVREFKQKYEYWYFCLKIWKKKSSKVLLNFLIWTKKT